MALAIVGFCSVELKLFGPVQLYVAKGMVLANSVNVCPAQIGLLLEAVGAAGGLLITTVTVPPGPVQPFTVAVTVYIPAAAAVTLGIEGFCSDEEKLFGPVQLYVADGIVLAKRFNVKPTHTGLLLVATGAAGIALITTVVVAVGLVHPLTVTVTV